MRSGELLGRNGPFARRVPGFVARSAQQAMADAVEAALAAPRTLVAECGTGTGKTFAYLVPALRSGLRVLISTGTRNLQDQLYRRDLPLVRDVLELPVRTALLKGRANYLCLYRAERTGEEGRFDSRADAAHFAELRSWAGTTRTGDIAEIANVPEASDLWPLVTSTAENCLGADCPRYADCFVSRARREAAEAEVVVVNHHLFFADMGVRQEGFAQLLPAADAVIFDEAHQVPEVATNFFGVTLSSHQLRNLCRDAVVEDLRERSGLRELRSAAEATERAVLDLRLTLGPPIQRTPWRDIAGTAAVAASVGLLEQRLQGLLEVLEAAAARGPGLASCARRAIVLIDSLSEVTRGDDLDRVAWFETNANSFVLHLTPLDVAAGFQQRLQALGTKAWVYTSATLAVGEDFTHFTNRLGVDDAKTAQWDSPFDYKNQTLLYVPAGLPDPAAGDYTARVIEAALPVLRASAGRAFLLFTSHRALKLATELLAGRLDYPLLVQGSMSRPRLLERFTAAGNAVLLGTGSFWEGVDVPGSALSCVVIDKLPFAPPDDPVLKARADACTAAGRNPFMEYQVPEAVITLKQGAGRLIRSLDDSGVLVLCDPRLYTRSYGRLFLASLPPMPLTRTLAEVERFFCEYAPIDRAV